jgi:hypothetical protein
VSCLTCSRVGVTLVSGELRDCGKPDSGLKRGTKLGVRRPGPDTSTVESGGDTEEVDCAVVLIGAPAGGGHSAHSRTRRGARQQPSTSFPAGRERERLAARYGVVGVAGHLPCTCTWAVRHRARAGQSFKGRRRCGLKLCSARRKKGDARLAASYEVLCHVFFDDEVV